jgi:hypothetical protein
MCNASPKRLPSPSVGRRWGWGAPGQHGNHHLNRLTQPIDFTDLENQSCVDSYSASSQPSG